MEVSEVVRTLSSTATRFADQLASTWARTDALFDLVAPEAILTRPISLRHPFIFYVGHLAAFTWTHLCRGVLGRASFQPYFDEIFDRGIDPEVDEPEHCHPHGEVPDRWPKLNEVIAYRDRVRAAVIDGLAEVDMDEARGVMAQRGRVVAMAIEHEVMHQETLLYMVQQLPPEQIRRPSQGVHYRFDEGLRPRMVEIPGGVVSLGAAFESLAFGWDNEFTQARLSVPDFAIDSVPVSNGRFLAFVETGGYDRAEFWEESDWAWKQRTRLAHPSFWSRRDGVWWYRTLFEFVPLVYVSAWPVSVSLAEARAYARWAGARLPSEAEFHRAAYGVADGSERWYPWGAEPPAAASRQLRFPPLVADAGRLLPGGRQRLGSSRAGRQRVGMDR
jgi:formylglycine-generating enzyme required for sulfatase activity